MQQLLAFGGREGLQVGDDGASVFAIEVIPVHGRAEGFAVRAQAFFEQVFICASAKLGRPPSGGAWSAQLPEASRGVWQSEQRATSSTRYWPLASSSDEGFAPRRIVESVPANGIKVRRKRQRYNGRRGSFWLRWGISRAGCLARAK